MPDVLIFLAGVFFTLTAVLFYQLSRRIAALEAKANPASRHDWKALERHDLGEALLFKLANMRRANEIAKLHEEQLTALVAHVAAGGHPDDPPSKWLNPRKDEA